MTRPASAEERIARSVPNDTPIGWMTPAQVERFWSLVDASGGPDACHVWRGSTKTNGPGNKRRSPFTYGRFKIAPGYERMAHRIAWFLTNGPPPSARPLLDHICRNTLCVNVRHLRPCTDEENTVQWGTGFCARNRRKTHCVRGHELAGENLYLDPKTGGRRCVECRNMKNRETRAALAAVANKGTRPSDEKLAEVMRATGSCVKAAFVLGVSDRSVANWCNDAGIQRLRRAIRERPR